MCEIHVQKYEAMNCEFHTISIARSLHGKLEIMFLSFGPFAPKFQILPLLSIKMV
jgi:hypothetical protein